MSSTFYTGIILMIVVIIGTILMLFTLGKPAESRSWDQGAMRYIKHTHNCYWGRPVIASIYWEGKKTASGERFKPNGHTAAHRTLPFGSSVRITNPKTGKSVRVVINDRGPFVKGVEIDLAKGAAQFIGMKGSQYVCIG